MDFMKILNSCVLCPHKCHSSRIKGELGVCKAGSTAEISSVIVHYGEEPPISGFRGSGTIFFTKCNMSCIYCQNYQISQEYNTNNYQKVSNEKLAEIMIDLQDKQCHNVNLVSPTIWIANIAEAIKIARDNLNLKLPIVFNSGGYDRTEIIKMLKGYINIYMPDIRYNTDEYAFKYSGVKNYVENNRRSIIEMYNQVGGLKLNSEGVAEKGLIVRLLILPNNIGEVKKSLDFIKNELSTDVYISIMSQYRPLYKAYKYPELNRRINFREYKEILNYAEKLGLSFGSFQEFSSFSSDEKEDPFIPDFQNKDVFKFKK